MASKRLIGFLFFVGVLAGNCAASAQTGCEGLLGRFNAAIEKRSLDEAKALELTIATDAGCGMRLLDVQRRRSSFELLLANEKINGGASPLEYEALIVDADKPDVLWRAAVAFADMRFSQRRFGEATLGYERAVETIKNLAKTPVSPGEDTIKAVLQRAAHSRGLAANEENGSKAVFVTAAKDHRDGKIGGSMSQNIRGFKPTAVPIPIGFETATAKFTPVGEQAARELLEVVREQAPNEIFLVGHTDERGEAEYNMRLSAQRVAAVAAFLRQNGITGKITTFAKGKSEPLQLGNVPDLTREDIWALNRRVVWKRNQ